MTIDKWLDAQRINGGPHGFECIGIERMRHVWDCAYRQGVIEFAAQSEKDCARIYELEQQLAAKDRVLREIAKEWAGAECGEPFYAQEAYAIGLAKRMYQLAVDGLK